MTRSRAREIAIRITFSLSFSNDSADEVLDQFLTEENFQDLSQEDSLYVEFPDQNQLEYIRSLVRGVFEHGAELDSYIEKYSVGWKFSRIGRMPAAIMRVSMYEILYMPDIPDASAINEAVIIAKNYEEDNTVRFINGILGSFVRKELVPEKKLESADETEPE